MYMIYTHAETNYDGWHVRGSGEVGASPCGAVNKDKMKRIVD